MNSQNVERRNLSEMVADRIKSYIIENSLGAGDRLPTEQKLAELFGVSRVSVREATKALAFLGIIQAAPRRGLTVGRVDMHRVTEYLGFHFALNNYPREQLLNTRIVIETGALFEAMEHIAKDKDAAARLEAANERLEGARSADEFIAGDVAFHRTLLETSGIEPLVAFNGLLEVFFKRFRQELIGVIRTKAHRSGGIRGHRDILAALRERDLQKAQGLLREHLAHYRHHL